MATRSEEHERTMAFAEIALGQIKALGLSAIPRNYEIFYAYATGTTRTSIRPSTAACVDRGRSRPRSWVRSTISICRRRD